MYVCIYIYTYNVCIYIYRERERERERSYTHIIYIYTHTYIKRDICPGAQGGRLRVEPRLPGRRRMVGHLCAKI